MLERHSDGLMRRTMMRPLPAGRVRPRDALAFGLLLAGAGGTVPEPCVNFVAAVLAALSLVSYVLLYTPLKTRTPLCTLVGAIAGAIPPMIGYAAAAGGSDMGAWALFLILFIWQMPHFLAIAWLYRDDYVRAGQMVLPVVDASGVLTARQIVLFSIGPAAYDRCCRLRLGWPGRCITLRRWCWACGFLHVRHSPWHCNARGRRRGGCSWPRCCTCRCC